MLNKPYVFKTEMPLTERIVPLVNIHNFLSTFVIYLVGLKAKKKLVKRKYKIHKEYFFYN